jgi:preprotein translocase subunit SecG
VTRRATAILAVLAVAVLVGAVFLSRVRSYGGANGGSGRVSRGQLGDTNGTGHTRGLFERGR